MEFILNNVLLPIELEEDSLPSIICKKIKVNESTFVNYQILRKELYIVTKKKKKIYYKYNLIVKLNHYSGNIRLCNDATPINIVNDYTTQTLNIKRNIVVVGLGLKGLFIALILARAHLKPTILERGKKLEERIEDLKNFDEVNNSSFVFGEGGRSLFQNEGYIKEQGYLKDKYILNELIKHGAPQEIYYQDYLHLDVDTMISIIKSIREEILSLGGRIYYQTTFLDYVEKDGVLKGLKLKEPDGEEKALHCDDVILCVGNLARDTYRNLYNHELKMQAKPFYLGVKLEVPQEEMNKSLFEPIPFLERLDDVNFEEELNLENKRHVLIQNSTIKGRIIPSFSSSQYMSLQSMVDVNIKTNNYSCSVLCELLLDDFVVSSPLDGIYLQEMIERNACSKVYINKAPCQKLTDFLIDKSTTSFNKLKPTYSLGTYFKRMDEILPPVVCDSLRSGLNILGKRIKAFKNVDAILLGVDTTLSSSLYIERDEETLSSSIKNLYPTSTNELNENLITKIQEAMKVANRIIRKYQEEE